MTAKMFDCEISRLIALAKAEVVTVMVNVKAHEKTFMDLAERQERLEEARRLLGDGKRILAAYLGREPKEEEV